MENVLIIGAGEIGQALKFLLAKAGKSKISMWDREEGKVPDQGNLSEIVPKTKIVFLGIPSKAIRPALLSFRNFMSEETIVVSVAKGIEQGGKTMEQILQELLPGKQVALLFGPMIAEELVKGFGGAAVLAAVNKQTYDRVKEIFGNTLRLDYSSDMHGVALSGVLKNIYSIGLGIVYELNLGTNFRGWYVSESCLEMKLIIEKLGGVGKTVYSPAGIGDFIATGFSPDSRNHQVGKALANNDYSLSSEGSDSLPRLNDLLGEQIEELPILQALTAVVIKKKPVKDFFPKIISD